MHPANLNLLYSCNLVQIGGIILCNCLTIEIPGCEHKLTPGCKIKIGRFETVTWVVSYGWYTWGGNRPVCGWYLTDYYNPNTIKPLQLSDLADIYLLEN